MEEHSKSNKFPYKEARLSDAGGDLSKQWVVVYYAWDVNAQKLVRKRVRIEGDTVAEREKLAEQYVKEINRLLKKGFHLDSTKAPQPLPEPEPVVKPNTPKQITFQEAAVFYKKIKARELRGDTTMGLYDLYIRHFLLFLDDRGKSTILLKNITSKLAHEFFDQVEVGNRHRNNMLGFFKSFFTFFIDREEILDKNPFKKLNNLKVDESDDHRPFTADQTKAIREVILARQDEQLWLFCQFIYFLFLRPGKELRFLKVGDLLERQVKVVSGTAKNRKIGYVDIPSALEQLIEHYRLRSYKPTDYVFTINGHPGSTPVGVNYFYKRHRVIMEKLELFGQDYDLYSWKPTGAVALYRATKDILRVQRHCRHSSPDQTYTYLRKFGLVFEGVDMTDFPAIWS